MNAKLTLRLNEELIARAKNEAAERGKSVSQMVAEFFESLETPQNQSAKKHTPITTSLLGVLRDKQPSEDDHKRHLMEKHS